MFAGEGLGGGGVAFGPAFDEVTDAEVGLFWGEGGLEPGDPARGVFEADLVFEIGFSGVPEEFEFVRGEDAGAGDRGGGFEVGLVGYLSEDEGTGALSEEFLAFLWVEILGEFSDFGEGLLAFVDGEISFPENVGEVVGGILREFVEEGEDSEWVLGGLMVEQTGSNAFDEIIGEVVAGLAKPGEGLVGVLETP